MNVIRFGASGMVGKGVLLECLEDARVRAVLLIGRAMINAAAGGHEKNVLENPEINALAVRGR